MIEWMSYRSCDHLVDCIRVQDLLLNVCWTRRMRQCKYRAHLQMKDHDQSSRMKHVGKKNKTLAASTLLVPILACSPVRKWMRSSYTGTCNWKLIGKEWCKKKNKIEWKMLIYCGIWCTYYWIKEKVFYQYLVPSSIHLYLSAILDYNMSLQEKRKQQQH